MLTGTLIQFVDFLSQIIQISLLMAFLFIVNPISTLGIFVIVGAVYSGIYAFVRKKSEGSV